MLGTCAVSRLIILSVVCRIPVLISGEPPTLSVHKAQWDVARQGDAPLLGCLVGVKAVGPRKPEL